MFITSKDDGLIPYVLTQILDACVNGVTLSDPDLPDCPLVYVNRVFQEMSGYSQDEMIGRNCRFLQGADRDQPELKIALNEPWKNSSIMAALEKFYHAKCSLQGVLQVMIMSI